MFRVFLGFCMKTSSSPHARGDVPPIRLSEALERLFSPRPWGCSVNILPELIGLTLLPTPVGMFRARIGTIARRATSPHARGDVPRRPARIEYRGDFSPRPWGCSGFYRLPRYRLLLLPTPVGMFRVCSPSAMRDRPSPHARGDVPPHRGAIAPRASFSPRPWGCSEFAIAAKIEFRLLPTPVGMFRANALRFSCGSSSPHARGDVPTSRRRSCAM